MARTQTGKIPSVADVEFIFEQVVKKTLAGIYLTQRFRQKGFSQAFLYNTWEYKPIVEIVCNHLKIDSGKWCCLQEKKSSDAWLCLEEAFQLMDARKYRNRGIFHFIRKSGEAGLVHAAVLEVNALLMECGNRTSQAVIKLAQGIQHSIDILSTGRAMKYFGGVREGYEISSSLLKIGGWTSLPSLPFLSISRAIRQIERWRLKNHIPAYAYLYVLKSDQPLIDLPNLIPPFGPRNREMVDEALFLVNKSRWLKWKETELMTAR